MPGQLDDDHAVFMNSEDEGGMLEVVRFGDVASYKTIKAMVNEGRGIGLDTAQHHVTQLWRKGGLGVSVDGLAGGPDSLLCIGSCRKL